MGVPKLVVIGGSLATGKSTVATALSQAMAIPCVSLDAIKEALFDVGGFRDRAWSKDIGRAAFPVFQRLIGMCLERGESVIAVATFLWPDDADWLEELTQRNQAELIQVWMATDPRVARERFIARANTDRHPGHCDSLETVMAEFDERFFSRSFFVPLPLSGRTLVVDTTHFDTVRVQDIISFLCD